MATRSPPLGRVTTMVACPGSNVSDDTVDVGAMRTPYRPPHVLEAPQCEARQAQEIDASSATTSSGAVFAPGPPEPTVGACQKPMEHTCRTPSWIRRASWRLPRHQDPPSGRSYQRSDRLQTPQKRVTGERDVSLRPARRSCPRLTPLAKASLPQPVPMTKPTH